MLHALLQHITLVALSHSVLLNRARWRENTRELRVACIIAPQKGCHSFLKTPPLVQYLGPKRRTSQYSALLLLPQQVRLEVDLGLELLMLLLTAPPPAVALHCPARRLSRKRTFSGCPPSRRSSFPSLLESCHCQLHPWLVTPAQRCR